jgi:hypothetical protein
MFLVYIIFRSHFVSVSGRCDLCAHFANLKVPFVYIHDCFCVLVTDLIGCVGWVGVGAWGCTREPYHSWLLVYSRYTI